MRGEVVATYVFDLGGEVDRERVQRVLDEAPQVTGMPVQKAAPKYVSLPRPLAARFPPVELVTGAGKLRAEVTVRVYEVGAAALQFRIPFEEQRLEDVHRYLDLRVETPAGPVSLGKHAGSLYAPMRESLKEALVEPYDVTVEPEPYTVVVFTEPPHPPRELMTDHRAQLAALLSNEPRADKLAAREVEDNLRFWYAYYEDDLVVLDWDYALIVDKPGQYEDVLFIMELANVQLLELRTYDAYLDRVLDKAYADLDRYVSRTTMFRAPRALMRDLSEARIDLARVSDNIGNIGKLFGDYYLAKVYLGLTRRFHIHQWEQAVNAKLRTLNDLYAMAAHEVEARRALILEAMIVLLFIVDLALLVVFFE